MPSDKINKLIEDYLTGSISEKDNQELIQSILSVQNRDELEKLMELQYQEDSFTGEEEVALREELFERIQALKSEKEHKQHTPLFSIGRSWWRYAAAALIVLSVLAVYLISTPEQDSPQVKSENTPSEVLPGSNKAVLTLADGSTIVLDNAAIGNVAQEGGTQITKLSDGQLAYNSTGAVAGGMNNITIPSGGQYQVVLPDGSKVWLNSASSIQFPTVFSEESRMVTITGEVYMEIAKNPSKPFIVKVNDMEVKVLGTQFNINAYSDELAVKTTLLEGTVKVIQGSNSSLLNKSGQQARVQNGAITLVSKVNTDQVMGWKNNIFYFEEDRIDEVMRQLARWYNIEVKYESNIPNMRLSGKMQRSLPLAQVLEGLGSLDLRFRMEGRTLIVIS